MIYTRRSRLFQIIILALCISSSLAAQECTCLSTAQWAITTFEENDAGYRTLVEAGDVNKHQDRRATTLDLAARTTDAQECQSLIYSYMSGFRDGHIAFNVLQSSPNSSSSLSETTQEEIRLRYADAERYQSSNQEYKDTAGLAGEYTSDDYLVNIVSTSDNPAKYVGYIQRADSVYWMPDQIKFSLEALPSGGYRTYYLMRNHSRNPDSSVYRLDDRHILIAGFLWEKRRLTTSDTSVLDRQIAALRSSKPSIYRYDTQTMVVRFPDFNIANKTYTDSLIEAHRADLTSSAYLVVDLRNNAGGADRVYSEIMQMIRTRPALTKYKLEYYSTPTNQQYLQAIVDNGDFPPDLVEVVKKNLALLRKAEGTFVTVNFNTKQEEEGEGFMVAPYPSRVGVLIDRYCGSSGEQFALYARESWKVKLFGEPTAGGIDMSNVHTVQSPCGDYNLMYAVTRTSRAKIVPIDDIGVQPDFPLDVRSNPYGIISEVVEILKE